jgi:hypothetical protein
MHSNAAVRSGLPRDDRRHVILVAEHDLTAPLVDLITAVMALGDEV